MKGMNVRKVALAGLSGLMLTASFPSLTLDWIAWIACIPLLISLHDQPPLNAFKLGLFCGLCHYATLLYWIVVALSRYGDIPLIPSIAVLVLLVVYLALYPAFFALLFSMIRFFRLSSLLGAGIWISLEYARAHLLSGFPWCLLGYSQFLRLPLLQIADITGVYGISFIVILVNLVLYRLLFRSLYERRVFLAAETAIIGIMVGVTLVYGYSSLRQKSEGSGDRALRAAIVQGNIDQSMKWDEDFQYQTVSIYHALSLESAPFRPHIILWPETAVPFFFQDSAHLCQFVYRAARVAGSIILFGSPAYEKRGDSISYYNRVYLLQGDGDYDYYDKVHLLPFGEYVPLKRFLPFVHRIVPAAGDFAPGRRLKPLTWGELRIGPLICYEAIFPELSREHALQGSQLLVNVTNDAWFGRTSAPYQHLSMAVLRCVETHLPMARAANTGVSAFILGNGKIVKQSGLFTREILRYELQLGHHETFYSHYGDIFAIIIIIGTIICLIWVQTIKRR
ncbi:MAG: apolipoprotein N-acyltransferase [Deltaproteobacteria bacterium]|nr:apolipoprotein N-acyltransferase [Deltaproteobacteria bacterium]